MVMLVVGLDLGQAGVTSKRAEIEERLRGCRAVQVAVVQDRTGEGALRAAIVGMQVHDKARPERPHRQGEGLGPSVRVARVREHVTDREPPRRTGARAPGRSCHRVLDDKS